MMYDNFINICKKIGKQMPSGEEWKTVKYIHTPGQGSPALDVERAISRNEVDFIADGEDSGFVITETPASDISININNPTKVKTFMNLDQITDMSFILDDSEPITDIYDIVNKLDSSVGYPVKIWFLEYEEFGNIRNYNDELVKDIYGDGTLPLFKYKKNDEFRLRFRMSRNLSNDDYTVSIKNLDNETNTFDITKCGNYLFTIECKGKYQGIASCIVTVE